MGREIARVSNRSGEREDREVARRLRVDLSADGLISSDAGADEDRRDDCQPSPPLSDSRAQRERDPQRKRGQRITEVVDQVGEQRDAAARQEHRQLKDRRHSEYRERERDSTNPISRALYAVIDQAVRMAMPIRMLAVGTIDATAPTVVMRVRARGLQLR